MQNKKFSFYVNRTIDDLFADLKSSAEGLSSAEAQRRHALSNGKRFKDYFFVRLIAIFINQFKSPFVYMLLAVMFAYLLSYQAIGVMILFFIVMINVMVGFYQEYQSNKAMTLFKTYLYTKIKVMRSAQEIVVDACDVVSGDIIKLSVGDIVPADCRLIESEALIVDESWLTGDVALVEKTSALLEESAVVKDAYNCCFAGTMITSGSGVAIVFATGKSTEYVSDIALAYDQRAQSRLIKHAMDFAHIILFFVVISLVFVTIVNMFIEKELSSLFDFAIFSTALGISAIPSALPFVISFCLSKGAMVLHKHKVIVKNFLAIEGLGGIDVLCFDHMLLKSSDNKQALEKAQALGLKIKFFSEESAQVCFDTAVQLDLEDNIDNIVQGKDFEHCTEKEKMALVYERSVFSGLTSEQKFHVIAYLQRNYFVGFMTDDISDTPALKIAQVGIASSDAPAVVQETAECLLLEKSLPLIILSIQESRKVLINALKYVKITISSSLGNFFSLAFSSLLINYLPMLPLQLLFLDLVTDFPLIVIATDNVGDYELTAPLHYSVKDIFITFLFGLVSTPFNFMLFILFKHHPGTLQTCWFIASALSQIALIFSLRTHNFFWRAHVPSFKLIALSLFSASVALGLPFTFFGQKVFLFSHPSLGDMAIVFGIVIAYFFTIEIVKWFYYRIEISK